MNGINLITDVTQQRLQDTAAMRQNRRYAGSAERLLGEQQQSRADARRSTNAAKNQ